LPHLIASSLALGYAWMVSRTAYMTTSVEFVSPLAIIVLVHLAWIGVRGQLVPGFAGVVFGRSLATTAGIAATAILLAIFAPMPAEADAELGPTLGVIFVVLACLAVVAFVLFVAAAIMFVIVRFILIRIAKWRASRKGDTRLHDFGCVAIALLIIGAASLEGLTQAFSFAPRDSASTTVAVAVPPARVWLEVGHATSPDFPLPAMLRIIPRPVSVIDEGGALGARRIVRFQGRQGKGDLVLQVARRTALETVFVAVSDTTPIAKWVRQHALTFRVEPLGAGSSLTVSLDYDRLLAPAWFFRPFIHVASFLAVDVLARDTKERAEAF